MCLPRTYEIQGSVKSKNVGNAGGYQFVQIKYLHRQTPSKIQDWTLLVVCVRINSYFGM
jgi:hypothetical protein